VSDISIEDYTDGIPPIERCMLWYQVEQCDKGISILEKMLDEF